MIRRKVFLFTILLVFAGLAGCTRIENFVRGAIYEADQEVPGADPYRYDFAKKDTRATPGYASGQLYRYNRPGFAFDGFCIESCDLLPSNLTFTPPDQGGVLVPDPTCVRVDASASLCCRECTAQCPNIFIYLPDEKRVVPIDEAPCDADTRRKVYISKKRLCRLNGGC